MYLMYVDESGDPGYPRDGKFPPKGTPTRFFVRVGAIIDEMKWLEAFEKVKFFRRNNGIPWDLELKASDLKGGKRYFRRLNQKQREELLLELYDLVNSLDVTLIGVVIRKEGVDLTQSIRYTKPDIRSLELLTERYNNFLNKEGKLGIMILDSTELRHEEELRYFQSYLLNVYSPTITQRSIVESCVFSPSDAMYFLQVADWCAAALFDEYNLNGRYNTYSPYAFLKSPRHLYCKRILKKLHSSAERTAGIGIKVWPAR